jgi:hypothetical protein
VPQQQVPQGPWTDCEGRGHRASWQTAGGAGRGEAAVAPVLRLVHLLLAAFLY